MNSPIKNEYSIREKFQLGWWLLKTKLLNPKARLIRFPFTIRGGGYIDLGKGLTTGVGCRLEAFRMNDDRHKRIIFGNNIQMNDYVHISAIEKVEIGSNVLMASHIYISDNSHGFLRGHCKRFFAMDSSSRARLLSLACEDRGQRMDWRGSDHHAWRRDRQRLCNRCT